MCGVVWGLDSDGNIWGAQEGYTDVEDMKAILSQLGTSEDNQNAVVSYIYMSRKMITTKCTNGRT